MYPYHSSIYLKQVTINVADMQKALLFYQDVLGMTIIEENNQRKLLGADQEALVELIKTTDTTPIKHSYGLYHMAILVPSQQDLADILKRLTDLQIPLIGGADHGYSEALYLEDFEGNGIEIYRDKPIDVWDIREDGRIVGITEELDGTALYQAARTLDPYHLPTGTRMGHVHLQVKNSKASSLFYQNLLDIEDKFSMSTGSWLASGNYHHHLAVNEWAGKNQLPRQENMLGLAYYVVHISDKKRLIHIFENAKTLQAPIRWLSSNQLLITDPDGIVTKIEVN